MTKYSIVIELDYPYEDELTNRELERHIGNAIQNCKYLGQNDLVVEHLEASKGSLQEAFGVGLK